MTSLRRIVAVPLAIAMALAAVSPVHAGPASPSDAYGYTATRQDPSYVDGSTLLPTLVGDSAFRRVLTPFPITLYGVNYTVVDVDIDGYAVLGNRGVPAGRVIPSADHPNGAVYAFWDDLVVDDQAGVWTHTDGAEPNRRFVVEWRNVTVKSAPGSRLSAEIVFTEGGQILLQYQGIDRSVPAEAGASAVVGIENETGTIALPYSQNEPQLSDDVAVLLRVPGTALARGVVTDANTGAPLYGATVESSRVTTKTIGDGEYQIEIPAHDARIQATMNGYAANQTTIDTAAENTVVAAPRIALGAPVLTRDPGALEVTVPAGQRRTATVTISNTGTAPGTWQTNEIAGGTAVPSPDNPGQALRSWLVPPETGYGIAELDGDVWISSVSGYSRFTPDGVLLQQYPLPVPDEKAGDLTAIPGEGLVCYLANRSVGPTTTIRCIRPLTGELVYSVTGADWGNSNYGLAYKPQDDTFFVTGQNKTVVQVKGVSYPDAGTVIHRCGLGRFDTHAHIGGMAYTTQGSETGLVWIYLVANGIGGTVGSIQAVRPEGCGSAGRLPDPVPGAYTGAGLDIDAAGNVWALSGAPYRGPWPPDPNRKSTVTLLQTPVPTYSDVQWLSVSAPVTVAAGQSAAAEISLDTTGLRPGVYGAALQLVTNGPKNPLLNISIKLIVT
jgi:hypothetical protein